MSYFKKRFVGSTKSTVFYFKGDVSQKSKATGFLKTEFAVGFCLRPVLLADFCIFEQIDPLSKSKKLSSSKVPGTTLKLK